MQISATKTKSVVISKEPIISVKRDRTREVRYQIKPTEFTVACEKLYRITIT